MTDIKQIVINGWNKIAPLYHQNRNSNKYNSELQKFINFLPKKSKVLGAGSGSGIPTAKYLTKRGVEVIGIDISSTMLEMAKSNVPSASFLLMDMTKLEFPENFFEGVVCVYSIFHVPKKNHLKIFQNFHSVLKPRGILLLNTGIQESEGFSKFFGAQMFWSNHDPRITLNLVKKAGFQILSDNILQRGGELQYWIFARK